MKKLNSAALVLLMSCSWAFAHHDAVVHYDKDTQIVHRNVTVLEWRFTNPHATLVFEAPNASGELVEWTTQSVNANQLARYGYTADSFRPGDVVTVHGSPSRIGRPDMVTARIIRGDGSIVSFEERAAGSPPPEPVVGRYDDERDFSGVWQRIRGSIPPEELARLVPVEAFFWNRPEREQIPLTAAGKAFLENWTPDLDMCRPTSGWMGQSTPFLHELGKRRGGRLHVRTEYFDQERTIWLDGRAHPPPELAPLSYQGHSSGRWEGNELVVETVHMLPNQMTRDGVYHSEQAVMKERLYREGDVLTWLRVIEDAKHFTQPIASVLRFKRAPYPEVPAYGECTPY